MQIDRESALRAAHEALKDVVASYSLEGRSTVAASLKSALKRRFSDRFDERSIGFLSFRDFLKDAEARGIVQLQRAPGGDLEAMLPGAPPQRSRGTAEVHSSTSFVRADIWRAFVDWNPGWTRLYDAEADRAVMFPETTTPFDPPEWSVQRDAAQRQPERFREIEPISMDTQLEWMRAFAREVRDQTSRELLQSALQSSRPFGAFVRQVNIFPETRLQWHRFRLDNVLAVVAAWVQRNNLTIQFQENRPRETAPSGKTTADVSEAAVRARLRAIIDRMPLSDLLRLEIPVGYILD